MLKRWTKSLAQASDSAQGSQIGVDFGRCGAVNLERPLKRLFDLTAASLIILFALPLIVMITVALLLSQGRPILIRHKRVGHGGRHFPCFKFRTMVRDADVVLRRHIADNPAARHEWEATRKLKCDPRVTALGLVLRKSSVDELPQLYNVLRGDMSLVGPRPIVDDEIKFYGPAIRKYYSVRPGVTGLWQVSGRSDVSYGSRVQLDVAYIETATFPKDLLILLKTVPAVLRSKGCY